MQSYRSKSNTELIGRLKPILPHKTHGSVPFDTNPIHCSVDLADRGNLTSDMDGSAMQRCRFRRFNVSRGTNLDDRHCSPGNPVNIESGGETGGGGRGEHSQVREKNGGILTSEG